MAIEKYLGIEYKHLGRGLDAGDCLNLPLLFYKDEFGINVENNQVYAEDWYLDTPTLILDNLKNLGFVDVPIKVLNYGDVLVFKWRNTPSHLGIYIGGGNFLHTGAHGTGLSSVFSGAWARRVHSVWRLGGLYDHKSN
jgi:cell wall-associated NlpC family hydrolase